MTISTSMTLRSRALLGCMLLVAAVTALAQEGDPPGRVARASALEGSVSLQPAGVQDWTTASLNRPLTTGDKIWADRESRAELDLGAAVVRIGSTTGFSFLNLDDHTAQLQLTAGTLIIRVRNLQSGDVYEIDTPNAALTVQQTGEYRLEVSDSGDATIVKVSEGSAIADSAGQSYTISAQQAMTFAGDAQPQSATLGAPDALDSWSAARERLLEDSPSRAYVADDVAGAADLDASGTWQSTPEYGYVWTPAAVEVGWAPYRFGHWAWITPWGWTWIDDASWGFAPFHYGRWVTVNSAWCWVPGPRGVHAVYAPAMVAWISAPAYGEPGDFGPNVGWFPLAPREVFVAAYHVSPNYARNVNITNTTIVNTTYITNLYQNNVTNVRYVNNTPQAITAVPRTIFTSGERVAPHAVHVTPAVLRTAAVSPAPPPLIPARQSVLGPPPAHPVARPPAPLLNRPVIARTPPPRAPVPFERQLAAIQANGGRPLGRAELARLQPPVAAAPVRVLPARSGAPVAARPTATPSGPQSMLERERALRNSRAPASGGAAGEAPARQPGQPAPRASTPERVAPPPRTDRPPAAQAPTPPTPARAAPTESRAQSPTREVPPPREVVPPPRAAVPPPREYVPPPREVVAPESRRPQVEMRPQVSPPAPVYEAPRVPPAPVREPPRAPVLAPRPPSPPPQSAREPRETPPAAKDPRDRNQGQ